MKGFGFLFIFLLCSFYSFSQSSSKVKWEFELKEVNGKKMLECKAIIAEHWHLYSQHIEGDGPIPTTFTFKENESYTLIGEMQEGKAQTTYDPNFDMQISFFEGTATFSQEIIINTKNKTTVSGSVEFMVCDDHMCYPPDIIEFTIDLH